MVASLRLAALCLTLLPATALAAPVVVWLEPEVPEERSVRRVEAILEVAATHLAHPSLAHPPQPSSEADDASYGALRTAAIEARARWNEFDVEYDIATDMKAALDAIDVVRDRRDLEDVVDARLLQGAAVARAFSEEEFRAGERAEPFRSTVPGAKVNRPWMLALALDPDRVFAKADLGDGSTFREFEALRDRLSSLPEGYLDLSGLPRDVTVVIDGQPVEEGLGEVPLRPGRHYVHVLQGGVVSGRQQVDVEAGLTTDVPLLVDLPELSQASAKVEAGSTADLPEDVRRALDAVAAHHGDEVYVGAVEGGKVYVEAWGGDVEPPKLRVVTVLGTGEIGGGVVVSPLFDGSDGETVTGPGAIGSLGLEIGIYNAAIAGGLDLAFTPGHTVTHGNADETDNVTTSVLPQPWVGVGAYVLRPSEMRTTLLVLGTMSWLLPAHRGLGGRITLGIPIDEAGTWFRLTVGGSTAGKARWAGFEDVPMHVGFLRFGFGARF